MNRSMRNRLIVGISLFVIGLLGYFDAYSVPGGDSRSLGSVMFEMLGDAAGSVDRAAWIIGGVGAVLCILVGVQWVMDRRRGVVEPEPKRKPKPKKK